MPASNAYSIPVSYAETAALLLEDLKEFRQSENTGTVQEALKILIDSRHGETTFFRKDYILSSISVARIAVREIGLGHTSVTSLFLYRALEKDSAIETSALGKYDDSVQLIATGLIKLSGINQKTTSSQAENFRRFLLNLAKDVRVILIRLAEQTEYMREMRKMKDEEQYKLALEANFLYAPLAHRLGLYLIKSEMEDLALKYTDRETYSMIAGKLDATRKAREHMIERFIAPIKAELTRHGFDYEIKGRPKSIHSIWMKMKKKEVEFEDIYDLFAVRIILRSDLKSEKADCWQVYSAITDIYQPNPLRMRDWISVPKTNGYESLHTTVIGPEGNWVEVQIRTERMNEIAEMGVAAHWKYKGMEGERGIDEWMSRVREILETPEQDADNFIDDFKLSLYSREIFVFTPKGDLKKFPEGATILDFAYDIHTDVGATCTGARVNGKSVPIRYKMQNGDKIEILTSKNQSPKRDWINYVVTSRAQKKIRQRLNEDQTREAENGKEIIKRRFKNWKIEYNDEVIRKLLKKYKFPNAVEFYCLIANGKIDLTEVKDFLNAPDVEIVPLTQVIEELESIKKIDLPEDRSDDFLIVDENVGNVDYKLAKCCSPIMGDSIFGFVTINEGIKIHRTNCPNAAQLIGKYGYRVVKTRWTRGGTESVFPVNIRITGEDHTTIMKNISEAIAKDLRVSIRSISLDASDGQFRGKISLIVRDLNHLENLINRISAIKGIYSVSRDESF
jgi:GTP pyrophosphokinase